MLLDRACFADAQIGAISLCYNPKKAKNEERYGSFELITELQPAAYGKEKWYK